MSATLKRASAARPASSASSRYDRDITRDGAVQPDLIIVEFAVNDEADETKGLMHESLIQKIWSAPNEPAVVMLFSVFANDWNLKDRLAPIGWRHGAADGQCAGCRQPAVPRWCR